MEQAIIQTKNLTKKYGSKTAVNSLNLQIRQGEIFGLLGPNGAGKTTTILMLLGLTEPTSGNAAILGLNCTREAVKIKRAVGYLPDNVGFYPDMTGRQNLLFTGKLNGLCSNEAETRAEALLARVGMTDAADQRTRTYSKGMKQRLGIADVLMKDPQIIIMDEPTLGIDPEGMRELLQLMLQLSREDGRTLLISSHQLYQIQQICDRVGIFVDGRLAACGKIRELGKQIQKKDHFLLELAISPCSEETIRTIRDYPEVRTIAQEENVLIIDSSSDIRKKLTEFLGSSGCTILQLRQKGGDLDEIYRLYFEREGQSNHESISHQTDTRKALPFSFGKLFSRKRR